MSPERVLIKGGTVITPFEELSADVLIEGTRIAAVGPGLIAPGAEVVDASGRLVAPGAIDLHIQGHDGRDFWDTSYDAQNAISLSMVRHGVTGIAPTTSGLARFIAPLADGMELGFDGAQFLGIHSEGPFINPNRRGAIDAESVAPLTMDALKRLLDAGRGHIRIMTIAPEIPNALEAVSFLASHGVIASLGHSMASHEEAMAGFDAGAARVTHLWNAMTSFADREDGGLVCAALDREDVAIELVCDGVHVHPEIIRLSARAKGVRMTTAITDSVNVAGLPPGIYAGGGHGKIITVEREGQPPRLPDGTIAGSSLSMDGAIRNLVGMAGFSIRDAFTMASYAPAAVLKLVGRKGEVAPGRDADIVVYSKEIEVLCSYVLGRRRFKR